MIDKQLSILNQYLTCECGIVIGIVACRRGSSQLRHPAGAMNSSVHPRAGSQTVGWLAECIKVVNRSAKAAQRASRSRLYALHCMIALRVAPMALSSSGVLHVSIATRAFESSFWTEPSSLPETLQCVDYSYTSRQRSVRLLGVAQRF